MAVHPHGSVYHEKGCSRQFDPSVCLQISGQYKNSVGVGTISALHVPATLSDECSALQINRHESLEQLKKDYHALPE